jgi:L-seryl-tRNA(Ser) seleniumtransferase
MDVNKKLRSLPQISQLMQEPAMEQLIAKYGPTRTTDAARQTVEVLRSAILANPETDFDTAVPFLIEGTRSWLELKSDMQLRPVVNATGVILHTNLGRSPLSQEIMEELSTVLTRYSTLEYDVHTGERGKRESAVEARLSELAGAEAAVVVNNNAAAVLLLLSALAAGKEVLVSRGELVEIGGAFRIPDVMEAGGAVLRAVGTTNKTHLSDYERAVSEETACILKVHTSNYRIVGFTGSVELKDLSALSARLGLPLVYDLGSGAILDLKNYGIFDEPTVSDALNAGADVVCFSGDKLFGGPQAGIIIGKKAYLKELKRHPLMRALRADKYMLAALELTLDAYGDKVTAEAKIPVVGFLALTKEEIGAKAKALQSLLAEAGIEADLRDSDSCVGGGSAPLVSLPSVSVVLSPVSPRSAEMMAEELRLLEIPVIGRIEDDRLWFDLRTVFDDEIEVLAAALISVWGSKDA